MIAKKKDSKKKRKQITGERTLDLDFRKRSLEQKSPESLVFLEYEITTEPIEDKNIEKLPKEVRERMNDLFTLVHSKPEGAINQLRDLIAQYPHIPQFRNYLTIAYSKLGDEERVNSMIIENYKKNPEYLFAKTHYAELCLQRGELDKIPEIFENKFDLSLLYPNRKKFHMSEVAAFMGVLGQYFFRIGKTQPAKAYYRALKEIYPHNIATKRLRHMLYPSIFVRALRRLIPQPRFRQRKINNRANRKKHNQ